MPDISVIIPCYNAKLYLNECIDSVLRQTFIDFEVVIINDGSTDNSLAIIKKYADKDKRIKIIDQKNQGVVVARNKAIKQATGTYIFPLDSDDKIAPDCLELLHQAMIDKKGDVVYSKVEYFGTIKGTMRLSKPTKFNMLLQNCITCSALYKKSDALRYGGYDKNMQKGLEDYEFWWNFIKEKKIFYKVPKNLFFYRQRKDTRNGSFSKQEKKELLSYIRKKHKIQIAFIFRSFLRFLYQQKTTNSGKQIVKICKIPVFIRRVKI